MTVESDHAISLVLVSFPFLSASEKLRVITQAIRSKLSIGIGITGKSNCLVKPMGGIGFGLFHAILFTFSRISNQAYLLPIFTFFFIKISPEI